MNHISHVFDEFSHICEVFLLWQFCVICLPLISNCAQICLTPTIVIMALITTNGVYVDNIPPDSTSGELESHFGCVGSVESVLLVHDSSSNVIKPVGEAMVIVPKPNGDLRICTDLTKLNSVVRERFMLPTVEHSLGQLAGATIFMKLDANWGYWQLNLDTPSSYLTTFITPFGRFHYLRLPFGISSARNMNEEC